MDLKYAIIGIGGFMKNKYYDYGDGIIAIEASGMGKYGLHIVVNAHRFEMLNAIPGCWTIVKEKGMYYAAIVDKANVIFMHDLIVKPDNEMVEQTFVSPTISSNLVQNPYLSHRVRHLNGDGLCNLDANLFIGEELIQRPVPDYEMYQVPIFKTLTEEDFAKYSLMELLNSDDPKKDEIIKEYLKAIQEAKGDKLLRRLHSFDEYFTLLDQYQKGTLDVQLLKSCSMGLGDIYEVSAEEHYHHTSEYLFSGHQMLMYPSITYHIALKRHLCAFSGNRIKPGDEYTRYHIFLEDLTDNVCYALESPIVAEMGHEDQFPMTIDALDDFQYRLYNGYDMDFKEYHDIAANIGNNGLTFVKLKRRG